jgi:hypothetical protein
MMQLYNGAEASRRRTVEESRTISGTRRIEVKSEELQRVR